MESDDEFKINSILFLYFSKNSDLRIFSLSPLNNSYLWKFSIQVDVVYLLSIIYATGIQRDMTINLVN